MALSKSISNELKVTPSTVPLISQLKSGRIGTAKTNNLSIQKLVTILLATF